MLKNERQSPLRGPARLVLLFTSLLLLLTAVTACSNGEQKKTGADAEASSQVPAVLNYGYIGTSKLNYPGGAEGWGFYKGIIQAELKAYGIQEIQLTAFPNGPDLSESLISGRLNIGSLGDTPAILSRSTGAKTKVITQSSTHSIGYLIGRKDGPTTLADLKGKTISTQKGSFHHRFLAGLLKENNITDVKIVHMLIADAEPALARGEIDAMTTTDKFAYNQIQQGYPLIADATTHENLLGTGVTVVTEDYLGQFAEFPKAWNAAREKALKDLQAHQEEYYAFLAELYNVSIDVAKQLYPISEIKDTAFTDAGIELMNGTKQFLVDEGLAATDFDLKDWIIR